MLKGLRRVLYDIAKGLGDGTAITTGKVPTRIGRRGLGSILTRFMGELFK